MDEEDFEELLSKTNFDKREKNRWRRLWLETEPEDRLEMKWALIAQSGDDEQ